MTATVSPAAPAPPEDRRPGELTARELLRWAWRQLTSMRTALILLLLLALAAVPGSVIPQERVDSLKAGQWKDHHPTLAPVYERLGLFDVFGSVWFAAIYLLLMVSLIGCIIPRSFVYWRAMRAQPPPAPRQLTRMPDHAAYGTSEPPDVVLARARQALEKRGYRIRAVSASSTTRSEDDAVSAERGYLREAGNLLFHLSVVVVLVGFAIGTLFGYKGGVILVRGQPFANTPSEYDDFVPGTLFRASQLDPFTFTVDKFDVQWLESGPRQGMATGFQANMSYRDGNGPEQTYDLEVNHPLTIGSTELFLIGHGYAPVITVRDGQGRVVYSRPTVFLPEGQDFTSFGVVKAADARPGQIGLEGLFYPTFVLLNGDPVNLEGDDKNPLLSLNVYTGDLGLDDGVPQSVYALDTAKATPVPGQGGRPLRIDLSVGETAQLPDGLGSVTFDRMETWQRIQISQTPGKRIALGGVVLALVGLLGSLFIRPRRVWVRARRSEDGATLVEAAALDRSGGGEVGAVLSEIVTALQPPHRPPTEPS